MFFIKTAQKIKESIFFIVTLFVQILFLTQAFTWTPFHDS